VHPEIADFRPGGTGGSSVSATTRVATFPAAISTLDAAPESPAPSNGALETEAHARMLRARAALVLDHPFFGSLALRLHLKADPACDGLWTDGVTLGFNPQRVAAMSDAMVTGMQAHEVLHVVCGHHVRRDGRDEGLWNRACDYAVNGILLDAGFTLPAGFLDAPEHRGRTAEDIYAVLSRMQEEEKGGGTGDKAQGEAEASGARSGASGDQPEDAPATQRRSDPEQAPPELPEGDDGDGRGGDRTGEGEGRDNVETSFSGEVRDHPALQGDASDAARRRAERDLRIDLGQAVQGARFMGDLPAGLERLAGQALHPPLDWRTLLRRFIRQCTANDYSWTPPNRRYVHMGLHLPELVLVIDSSGSVDDAALARFCGEVSAILQDFDTRLTVIYCDCAVQEVLYLTRWDLPLRLTPRGGGGTDYRPAFARVDADGLRPACLICLTDLECNRFPAPPPYPVLWASTRPVGAGSSDDAPPFGEVLTLHEGA
jgi:predicted metal-dependent peptidase